MTTPAPIVPLPQPMMPVVRAPLIDSRSAMAAALSGVLRCAEFTRWGGGQGGENTRFTLNRIDRQWPEPDRQMDYPSATIIDATSVPYDAHSFVPTALEETFNQFGAGTVLWKTAEATTTFQVDFWCEDDPTREAILATLPMLFAPGEDQYGIIVQGPPEYFGRRVRLSLVDQQRMDVQQAVHVRERRLMARIRAEVDEVHLRRATLLTALVNVPPLCIGEHVRIPKCPTATCCCDPPCTE